MTSLTFFKKTLFVAVFAFAALFASGGSAQDDEGLGDLGIRVRQQNLDSYWLENRTWAEYGYRPHVTTNVTRFTNLPSVFAGRNYYAYGTVPPVITPQSIVGRPAKADIQMTKYGTWH
jgi:hypothetical protein